MCCSFDCAAQLGLAGIQTAQRESGFLRLALQAALLFAAFAQLALGVDHAFIELGVALLRVGQLHVQLFKAGFRRDTALLQVTQLGIDLGHVAGNLLRPRTGLFSELRQAQRFDLQLMRTALGLGSFAPHYHQSLRRIGVGSLGPHQRGACLVADQRLRPKLLVQIFDFLRAGQQTGLLRIGRIKTDTVGADGVATFNMNRFAGLQRRAFGQRVFKTGCGVTTLQPVSHHRFLPGIVDLQQIGQPRQRGCGLRRGGQRRAEERQLGRWRVLPEGAHHVQPRNFQRTQTFAQRAFQRVFPALLDVDAAPQTLQAIQPVLGQPGFELAIGLHLFLQRLERLHTGRQVSLLGGLGIDHLLLLAAGVIQLRHAVLQLMQAGIGHAGAFLCLGQLGLQVYQTRFFGCRQRIAVSHQPLATRGELA